MKNNSFGWFVTLTLGMASIPFCASAQLRITEAESAEASGTYATADWWELSNFGSSAVNLTGYTMDDSSDSFGSSVALAGITSVAPGESVVFFEQTGATPLTVQGFRDWWGPNLSLSVQVGTYSGSGVGLSSGGDGVNIFDSLGNHVDGVNFGAATSGTTFVFGDGSIGRSPTGLSQLGVDGAFASQNGDVGSPGAVPEPSVLCLGGLGIAALICRSVGKRRKQQ